MRRLPEEWTFVTQIPAIITEEEFALVQAKLARNRATARRNNLFTTICCGR